MIPPFQYLTYSVNWPLLYISARVKIIQNTIFPWVLGQISYLSKISLKAKPFISYHCKNIGVKNDLDEVFVFSWYDIICGRGNKSHRIEGNRRFHDAVAVHKERYQQAERRSVKTQILLNILRHIQKSSPAGRFIKKEGGKWIELEDSSVRGKIDQALREMIYRRRVHRRPRLDKPTTDISKFSQLVAMKRKFIKIW